MTVSVAAIDFGATSGRVMLGRVGPSELSVHTVSRFANQPVRLPDGLHWNILQLYQSALGGLRAAVAEEPRLSSIGVDSWAVDYGLLRSGSLLANPWHYRDERTEQGVASVHGRIGFEELYAHNGLQFLPFNTLYQFAADQAAGALDQADSFLLIPDLVNYWLTGRQCAERTNASTTGLMDISSGRWNQGLIRDLGLSPGMFPELVDSGSTVGSLLGHVADEVGADETLTVSAVGSHDTASAVVAVPMASEESAYISCGTWGLVGLELPSPVLTRESREANFTNEGGVDGRVRYLHNVMGLWILSESMRMWEREGETVDLSRLLAQAAEVSGETALFDANDPRFLPPGDMPARIVGYCEATGQTAPRSRPEFVRCILESLSEAFAQAVRDSGRLANRTVRSVNIVGGGSQNEMLCQLISDRLGLPVLAGPTEATAIGNVLIQARSQGLGGDLESLRALVAKAYPPRRYEPRAT